MELLIPGLILVALMVYASTRLKKYTAAAFEAESVETDEFAIEKPAGFLHVLNGDPTYAFEAYSREFGTSGAENIRRATVTIRTDAGRSIKQITADRIRKEDGKVSDTTEVVDGIKYKVIELTRTEKGVDRRIFHKLAESNGKVYDLRIAALSETTDELLPGIETLLSSFRIK